MKFNKTNIINTILTGIINSGFDAMAKGASEFGLFVFQFLVEIRVGLDSIGEK